MWCDVLVYRDAVWYGAGAEQQRRRDVTGVSANRRRRTAGASPTKERTNSTSNEHRSATHVITVQFLVT